MSETTPLACTWTVSVHIGRHVARSRAEMIIAVLAGRFTVWFAHRRRRRRILEIQSDAVDAAAVEAVLRRSGISAAEATVNVEYARRWGML